MMSLEAFMMIGLATAAVALAYTKLNCPAEGARLAWMPEGGEDDLPSGPS